MMTDVTLKMHNSNVFGPSRKVSFKCQKLLPTRGLGNLSNLIKCKVTEALKHQQNLEMFSLL